MVTVMTGREWGSDKEIEEKRVNKERQGRCRRINWSHMGKDKETEEAGIERRRGRR